jgi:hypothetical protein
MRRLAARLIAIAAAILGTGVAYGAAHRTYRPISGPIRSGNDHLRSQRGPREKPRGRTSLLASDRSMVS